MDCETFKTNYGLLLYLEHWNRYVEHWNSLAAPAAKADSAIVAGSPALFVQRDEFHSSGGRVP
jgi:hypothetical protein